jgi:diguanylate cyclase (GGDEF)-like protein/hemerythrin-like metal-binding protein
MLSIGVLRIDLSRQESIAELHGAMERLQQTNQKLQATMAELDRLKRYDHPLSLLIIDIDFFKAINDSQGHAVGDRVLADLADVVRSTLRATDSLTRWGGEEFVVLCPNTTLSTAAMLAERLREKIAKSFVPAVKTITASIGVAECMSGETWDQWFKRADDALYRAKACGRNQVQVAPETPQRVGVGENVSANFVQLVWHSAYECGQTLVDDQHRSLFGDANNMLTAILNRRPTDEIAALLDVLSRDVVQHFQDEEMIFTAAGFPGAAQHAAIHRELVASAVQLVSRFHTGTLAIGELFQFLAHDEISRHMLGADREFFPYLEARRS